MLAPTYVVSDNIDCAAYQHGDMYVRFKSGQCYRYMMVDYSTFDAMVKAESVGKFFHAFVRNKFEYQKLDYDPFVAQSPGHKGP